MRVAFGLLGEVRAWVDGRPVELGPARQRCVLAALLVDANQVVSLDRLVDRVWGEEPPRRAAATVSSYLSRLRSVVPCEAGWRVQNASGGYVLEVDEDAVDLHRMRRLLTRARAAEDAAEAAALYEEALGLWRGEAFGDVDTAWLAGLRHKLAAERLAARLDYHDVQLGRGEHAALLADLTELAEAHPLDERLVGQLMLALYRSGRQADAQQCYQRLRRRLADELGVDPGRAVQRLHEQIITADADLTETLEPAAAPVPRQLPAPPPLFTGRSAELAALDAALGPDAETTKIAAIGGSGGVGKTWLALHWAHRNLDRFPDGQLYVQLRGFDPSGAPMPSGEAVRAFLDAFAVDPATIPVNLDAQAALCRSLMADKRMLIVLDNARDTEQVAPLLPGGSSCTVLVTSRHQLAGLVTGYGARPVAVPTLGPDEARRLLTRQLGADRVAAEPEAVAGLLDQCAGLPLALGIVAARATMSPGLPLASIDAELREDSVRLDALDAGETSADLRAVFSWSYRVLTPDAARTFRLLGVHAGPHITLDAAASLIGAPVNRARSLLAELVRAHLAGEPSPGRFTVHDLLRDYAAERAYATDAEIERRAAVHRVLDHYLHTAHAAALLCHPHRPPITPAPPCPEAVVVPPAGHRQAMAWFAAEHPVLLAAIRQAAATGAATHTWQLAWTLVDYFDRQGHWQDLLTTQRTALRVTEDQADLVGQAHAHRSLGRANARLGDYDAAYRHFQRAVTLFTELGDRVGQARAHHGLGWLLGLQDRHREALGYAERSRDLFQQAGSRTGLALAFNAVGWCHTQLGEHRAAIGYCEQALDLWQTLGDTHGQAATLDSLGHAHLQLGDHPQAITCYERSLRLHQELGDRVVEADTLFHLADAHTAAGAPEPAESARKRAQEILAELGHP